MKHLETNLEACLIFCTTSFFLNPKTKRIQDSKCLSVACFTKAEIRESQLLVLPAIKLKQHQYKNDGIKSFFVCCKSKHQHSAWSFCKCSQFKMSLFYHFFKIEKIIIVQLQSFLNAHNILETFQSGLKALHSTETALFKDFNGRLLATDSGDCCSFAFRSDSFL